MDIGSTREFSSSANKQTLMKRDYYRSVPSHKDFTAFFEACRRPILSQTITSIDKFTRDDLHIIKVSYGVDEDSIEAYVLPKSVLKWPSFHDTDQHSEFGYDVLCVCTDLMSIARRKMIIDSALAGYDSITIGVSGIGKSCQSSFTLFEFLKNIGEEGYPSNVLYRIPYKSVYEFTLTADKKPVVQKIKNSREIFDVYNVTNEYRYSTLYKPSVLIYELNESENDPESRIPCIVTFPSENIDKKFPTLLKGGARLLLCEPPSTNQVIEQMKAFKLLSEDCDEFNDLSLQECIAIVQKRASIVGPIPKHLFSTHHYKIRCNDVSTESFFGDLHHTDADNTPNDVGCFIAPFFKDGATVPAYGARMPDLSCSYKFQFLTIYCINSIAGKVSNMIVVDTLRRFKDKLEYQIAEGMMVQALYETPTEENRFPENCYRSQWVIHEDPGYNGEISTNNALSKTQQKDILDGTRIPWALREQIFHGGHCSQDITTLDERVVYRSHLRNFEFGDNFMVNHDKKEI